MINAGIDHCYSFINGQGTDTHGRIPVVGVRRAVTISRQAGCGAVNVAEKLAAYLQQHSPPHQGAPWTVFDRELMDKVLADHNLPKHLARFLPEDRASQVEDTLAEKFGSQCIVVSIDAKKIAPDKWGVFSHGGRKDTCLDALEWAQRAVALGAGEIVLNSIDADGTKAGFDLVITRRVSEAVGVPVVASGGAGTLEHMAEVLLAGKADAVLAASIFHFGTYTVGDVKQFLKQQHIPVRLS